MTHCALLIFPKDYIHREATYAFVDVVKDWDMKQHLMGSERSLSEARGYRGGRRALSKAEGCKG
jgi:hypothetical protein